jgi:hypothetical protein
MIGVATGSATAGGRAGLVRSRLQTREKSCGRLGLFVLIALGRPNREAVEQYSPGQSAAPWLGIESPR